jgi:hypothetical protein
MLEATCSIEGCDKTASRKGWCVAHYTRWRRHGEPTAGGKSPSPAGTLAAWIAQHASYAGNECLDWPFAKTENGRGQVEIDGRCHTAARIMCVAAHGEPPTHRHQAAHSCGNGCGGCVNPRHLYWATPAENEADKAEHGTHLCGERVATARLTVADVHLIRKGNQSVEVMAEVLGVTTQNIKLVQQRKSWAWVP